ncbi:MAG: S8 family serine peptidase [Syntrophomonadaceae bacterium]
MLNFGITVPTADFEPGKLIVKFNPRVTSRQSLKIHASMGAIPIQHIPELNIHCVTIAPGSEMEYINQYSSSSDVIFAEPNYYLHYDFIPNDPFYSKRTRTSEGLIRQWGLRRINPEPAWNFAIKASFSLKIALIDSGIDPNHPDLAAKIVEPMNFSSDDPEDYIDRLGHGTWTAGIAAAVTNNKKGVAGTSFNTASIMPIKVGDEFITLIAVINAIIYAVQKGAKVINMSFGLEHYSLGLQEALDLAWNNGVVNVASSGNSGNEQVQYPAGNNYVVAVSATNRSNVLTVFSSWGVDMGVASPGLAILATVPGYPVPFFSFLNYDAGSGTSASAPFVSGVAALQLALKPSLSNQEVIQIIEQSARPHGRKPDDNKPKAWSPFKGYGLLNAGHAVKVLRGIRRVKGRGSFYGQVVNQESGLPVGGATVSAQINDEIKGIYTTKTNVPTLISLDTDGMFRLRNLPRGTYTILVDGQPVQTAEIIPSADRFLRLLI